jgi:hypothetical protein
MALVACLFASRISASSGTAESDPSVSDERAQDERENAHREALLAKEWHDTCDGRPCDDAPPSAVQS